MCPPNPSLRARPLPQPSFFRLMHPPLLSSLRHMHPPQYPLLRPGVLSILTPTQEYSPDLLRQTRHLPYHSSFRPKIPLQLPPSDSVRRVILSLPHAPTLTTVAMMHTNRQCLSGNGNGLGARPSCSLGSRSSSHLYGS